MEIKRVFADVLEKIKPKKEELSNALNTAKSFLKKLNENLKSKKISAKAILGGSFAKDAWLSGDYDIDVFVKFSQKHKKDDLSELLESALKSWKFERVHGSRDYFWIKEKGIKFEIVPVLSLSKSEQAKNVTDFSPLHVDWVNEHSKKLKNDIRLFKQFCKANKVYGAESYISGFSGHVVDILVIHFKGFLHLLKAASTWNTKKKIIIDHYNKYKSKALMLLNKSKTEGPLIIIDPVQPDRNASAALSLEKFQKFLKAAKAFLKKPSMDFFVVKPIDINELQAKDYFVIEATSVKGKEAVVGSKLLHVFEFLKYKLNKFDFDVVDADWVWNKKDPALFWFKVKNKSLPKIKEHKGPPVKNKPAVKAFKNIYPKVYNKAGCIYTKIKREFLTPEDLMKKLFKEKYVKDKVLNIKKINSRT